MPAGEFLEQIVDLDRYPIHLVGSPGRRALVDDAAAQLRDETCVVLPGFFRDDVVAAMQAEAVSLQDRTSWAPAAPYSRSANPKAQRSDNRGFINSDELPADSWLNRLYEDPVLLHFLWESLGVDRPIYPWADPVGRNPYGVTAPGGSLPWHFDSNEFGISVLVQEAIEGGLFEYVPNLRGEDDDVSARVEAIGLGERSEVRTIALKPGDLQVFKGRHSLHQVTEVGGEQTRYIGLPCYVFDPYRVLEPARADHTYGRSTEMHRRRSAAADDGSIRLDG